MHSTYAMEVERLRTEAVKNPVGIDVEKPMFSWMMDADNERGIWQTAYEISVFTDAAHSETAWSHTMWVDESKNAQHIDSNEVA